MGGDDASLDDGGRLREYGGGDGGGIGGGDGGGGGWGLVIAFCCCGCLDNAMCLLIDVSLYNQVKDNV